MPDYSLLLFDRPDHFTVLRQYEPVPDAQRFLVNEWVGSTDGSSIAPVLNWDAERGGR
jgi:hypothetical protein